MTITNEAGRLRRANKALFTWVSKQVLLWRIEMLKIEKYISGKREQSLHFPNLVVWMARRLLPNAAQSELAAKGISLTAIDEARKNGQPYQAELMVFERGIQKRVVVTLT